MYPWDEELADYIGWMQERYGWPKYIRTTTGKNRGERIIRVMRKTHAALPMTAAVQSLNPVVLKNIGRSNIRLDTYAEIQQEVRRQGMQSYGELIVCLPGETKASFLKAVSDLLDAGVQRISAHQLMLLHGAPLANPESRKKYGFGTRFRVVARNVGRYADEPVVEVEEVVVETPTFSFQDYLDVRIFHLLLTIFYYEGNFDEAFQYASQQGIRPFDVIDRLQRMLDGAPAAFRRVIDDFVKESREELFRTKEECLSWSLAHIEELIRGELGGNLLSKYSMLGRFYVFPEALDFLETAIDAALGSPEDLPRAALNSVIGYLRAVCLHAPFSRTLREAPQWRTSHDVEAWRSDRYARPLDDYPFAAAIVLPTTLDAARRAVLEDRLRTFGEGPQGLGKFTRTLFARDLRREVVPDDLRLHPSPPSTAARAAS
jgi:hypothetical protein